MLASGPADRKHIARGFLLALLILAASVVASAAPVALSDDARARARRDLNVVAADELRDLLAKTRMALPLPELSAPPSLSDPRDSSWREATEINLAELVRVEGLDLKPPQGTYRLCRHGGKLHCTIELPGARGAPDLLALAEAERPARQRGSSGKDTKSAASGGEVLGSNFGGGKGHFAEWELAVPAHTPDRNVGPTVAWFRVARGHAGVARWEVLLDGQSVGDGLAVEPTGGWNTLRWVKVELGEISAGAHTLRIVAAHDRANVNYDVVALSGPGFEPPNSRGALERLASGDTLIEFSKDGAVARLQRASGDRLALRVESGGEVSIREVRDVVIRRERDPVAFAVALPADALPGNQDWAQRCEAVIPGGGFLSEPLKVDLIPTDFTFDCKGIARTGPNRIALSWRGSDRPQRATLALKLRNQGEFRGKFGAEEIAAWDVGPGDTGAEFRFSTTHEGVIGTLASVKVGERTFTRLGLTYLAPARRTVRAVRRAVEELAKVRKSRSGERSHEGAAVELEQRATRLLGEPLDPEAWTELYLDAKELAHRALVVENPLLDFPLLFTRRASLGGSHYAYTEAVSWARDREWNFRPDSSLCVLSLARPDGEVKVLLDSPQGVIRDPDVYWDGSKALFSHKQDADDDFHLYEIGLPEGEPRQLTDGPFADYEGCYLPDGNIMFNSTRCVQTVPCWITPVSNLYLMGGDGRHIRRVSVNQVHDNFPSVMEDGRVVYTRWEYSDKGQLWVQSLFVINPDGTRATAHYGNNSYWPISQLHARSVAGTSKVVCTLAGHHTDQSGEIGIFDINLGSEEASGCVHIWPPRPIKPIRNETYVRGLLTRYQYPYSLSEHFFLVACKPQGRPRYGIYLIDTFGNQELIYEDPAQDCSSPMPLAPRRRPPALPSMVRYGEKHGIVSLTDVYRGPGLEGVKRGAVKALRIIELIFRPFGSRRGLGQYGPAGGTLIMPPMGLNCSWDAKRVVGTVPVHEDGSAMFKAPANTALCFQPIDDSGKALQWMRSWVTLMPGEVASCVGCHEAKGEAVPVVRGRAQTTAPVTLKPWLVSDRAFSFHDDVQPVLDRACISCHNRDHPQGIDLRGDKTDAFSLGYEHLRRFVNCPGPQSVPDMIPAKSTGAIASKLIEMLERGHHEVKLTPAEMSRLITWIDLNAPYYASYALTRPNSPFGRNVVGDPGALTRALGDACVKCHRHKRGFNWREGGGYDTRRAVLVNLTHPRESRLLRAPLAKQAGGLGLHKDCAFKSTEDERYQATLRVVEGWARELAENPREDMLGARPSEDYLVWWRKRAESRQIERESREALAER